MIELKDFVKQTLQQIIQGIAEAQEACKGTNATINPLKLSYCEHTSSVFYDQDTVRVAERIEFDIAVTATTTSETIGGGGVCIGVIALGTKGESKKEVASSNRIKFGTYVVLPSKVEAASG